jgi:hypothetical protein
MSASSSVLEVSTLQDRLLLTINKPSVTLAEIDFTVMGEFKNASTNRSIDILTDLGHLISFIRIREFSNPILALQTYLDPNTNFTSKKALVTAILMTSNRHDKAYELFCYLAQHNKLERFTEISEVPPVRFYQDNGEFEEFKEWYLLFELFSLSKASPRHLIKIIAEWVMKINPAFQELIALRTLLINMEDSVVLEPEYFGLITSFSHGQTMIRTIESLLLKLQQANLLHPNMLTTILPLLTHIDAINAFISIFQLELQNPDTCPVLLEHLPLYCKMVQPSETSYDDKVQTNTPLHQSIIDRNIKNLSITLTYANSNLLLSRSYENTALLLACKLADKEAARLILAKMCELGCTVNQADSHGMTALHWASFYHFDDLIEELIAAGANARLKNTDGKNCSYFYHHKFTINDFKREQGEIIEGTFKLKNASITDISFHMDKIALNLKLISPEALMSLYMSTPLAQIRSANRFQLFLSSFRDKLVNWLNQQEEQLHLEFHTSAKQG